MVVLILWYKMVSLDFSLVACCDCSYQINVTISGNIYITLTVGVVVYSNYKSPHKLVLLFNYIRNPEIYSQSRKPWTRMVFHTHTHFTPNDKKLAPSKICTRFNLGNTWNYYEQNILYCFLYWSIRTHTHFIPNNKT